MPVELVSPVGRIVHGHPLKTRIKTNKTTKQPVLDKQGNQTNQWVFGVAYTKQDFMQYIWPYMDQEARSVFPHGVPPKFTYKYKDGDGIDDKGQPFSKREGYAGHCVITFSTELAAPPVYKRENGVYRQLQQNEIKCGDYVAVKMSMKYNGSSESPGLYVNPVGIELVGYGQEIVNVSADPNEMFGGRTYQLPAGASATPTAPQGGAAPPYGGAAPPYGGAPAPMPGQPPQGYPAPAQPPMGNGAPPAMPQYGATGGMPTGPTAPTSAYPSNTSAPQQPLPAPAYDYVGVPQQGFTPPPSNQPQYPAAAPGAAPSMPGYAPQAPNGYAPAATGYPSNPTMPGMPPAR